MKHYNKVIVVQIKDQRIDWKQFYYQYNGDFNLKWTLKFPQNAENHGHFDGLNRPKQGLASAGNRTQKTSAAELN